jgi:hypothetical protein
MSEEEMSKEERSGEEMSEEKLPGEEMGQRRNGSENKCIGEQMGRGRNVGEQMSGEEMAREELTIYPLYQLRKISFHYRSTLYKQCFLLRICFEINLKKIKIKLKSRNASN